MLFQKQKDNFTKVKEQIEKYLKIRELDSAVALYNQLEAQYKLLDPEKKIEYEGQFIHTKDKLMMYMKIEELQQLARTDNLEEIRDRLIEVEMYLKYYQNLPKRFQTYIVQNYKHCLRIYQYKLYKVQLDEVVQEVYNLLTERNYEQALYLFPEIMHLYNEMSKYNRNELLLKKLEELKSHTKMNLLKERARAEPAEIKKIEELVKKGRIGKSFGINLSKGLPELPKRKLVKIKVGKKEPDPEIAKLKELIEKGDDKLSKEKLDKIFS